MASVIEKYAATLSSRRHKHDKVCQLLEAFFQERLDEIEAMADELLDDTKKKETIQ